ncbi:histone-lysine N-methyltransferase SETMAR [Sorex araneus]|uniref:histone-lysine N-methyltransferase SETMAR n=1 Tax=Sorex araneus TaxID=42254 RepID=UPI0024334C25|nr:histone-lysine N-methyltransferase SETMAR [Sorex araneus]
MSREAAASEAEPELLDIARGLENLPVSVWPPGAEPEPFEYWPDPVAGPGAPADPAEIALPGCLCPPPACRAACACLRGGPAPYDAEGRSLQARGAAPARPVFECGALCACGPACGNRVVQRGLQVRLQLFPASAKGWGLRALEPLARGRFVCEYAGEVLGAAEAARRLRARPPGAPNYLQAVREQVPGGRPLRTFVDPTRVGNVGRFLNHSCQPNLLMLPVRVHSAVPRLALFAARDVAAGEELTYDYSGRFLNPGGAQGQEEPPEGEPRTPCHCGAASCAGLLPFDGSLCAPEEEAPTQDPPQPCPPV